MEPSRNHHARITGATDQMVPRERELEEGEEKLENEKSGKRVSQVSPTTEQAIPLKPQTICNQSSSREVGGTETEFSNKCKNSLAGRKGSS